MRFLHLADLHIGKTVNGFPLIDDQRFALEGVLSIARERDVQALVIAGDLYDKALPSAEAVSLLDWFLTEASAANVTVLAVPGNHDSAERIGYASTLLRNQNVVLTGPYEGNVESFTLEDEHGPVRFWLIPFVKPAHVRPFFPEEDFGQNYTKALQLVLGACDMDMTNRNVAIAHQFVTAGAHSPETCDSEISLGGLDNVDVSVFDAFDYVALGHIHRAQRIGRDQARYAGSPLKYSLSEIPHTKSITLVELGKKGEVSTELIPLTPLHDLREIRGPFADLISEEVSAQQECHDYLRIVLTDEQPTLDALSRIRAVYPNVMAIEYDNERTKRTSRTLDPHDEPTQTDAFELFSRFYQEQNGRDLAEEQALIAREALNRALANQKEGRA